MLRFQRDDANPPKAIRKGAAGADCLSERWTKKVSEDQRVKDIKLKSRCLELYSDTLML